MWATTWDMITGVPSFRSFHPSPRPHPSQVSNDQKNYFVALFYYLAFAEGGPRNTDGFLFYFIYVFLGGRGGGGWRGWLVRSVHVTFSRHLGKVETMYCPLSSPKRAGCFRVCFHRLSGIVIVTHWTAFIGRSWRAFLERFWLRWFSPLSTYWGQVYRCNASLVFCRPESLQNARSDWLLFGPDFHRLDLSAGFWTARDSTRQARLFFTSSHLEAIAKIINLLFPALVANARRN